LKQPPKVGLDAMMMSKMYLKTVQKKIILKKKKPGGAENPKAKRQQTNLINNWFISLSPLATSF